MLDHQPLDLWALFRAVAQSGGYQAVSARRRDCVWLQSMNAAA